LSPPSTQPSLRAQIRRAQFSAQLNFREDAVQIALNDEEVGAMVELLYKSMRDLRLKITLTEDPAVNESLKHREDVLRHLADHLLRFSVPRAA
jgi:hypothetical protein